ncbi:hypothetical protein IG631_24161 [Alternaria alternata]|nr:hypothetical protein IG631_24161 [Alternaria alternata]
MLAPSAQPIYTAVTLRGSQTGGTAAYPEHRPRALLAIWPGERSTMLYTSSRGCASAERGGVDPHFATWLLLIRAL